MHKQKQIVSPVMLVFFLLTFFGFCVPFNSIADTNDRNGMKAPDSRGGYLDAGIEYYVRCSYINYDQLPFENTTTVIYNSDGTVNWNWEYGFDEELIVVHGIQIDNAGSFKVKAGDRIGGYYHSASTWDIIYKYTLYPMMQYDGMNILLTDWDDIIFRVGPDKIIRMECNKNNIPSDAKVGFGPIQTDYDYTDYLYYGGYENPYYVNYESSRRKYGAWMMFLDFRLVPLFLNTDSVDRIIDDNSETESPVYDIMGNRVDRNNLSPGIYICRGKKILVK